MIVRSVVLPIVGTLIVLLMLGLGIARATFTTRVTVVAGQQNYFKIYLPK